MKAKQAPKGVTDPGIGPTRRANTSQAVAILFTFLLLAIVGVVLIAVSDDPRARLYVGLTIGLLFLSTLSYFVWFCGKMCRQRQVSDDDDEYRGPVNYSMPCGLCGKSLGGVCRMHPDELVAELPRYTPAQVATNKQLCPIAKGQCGHVYHFHCIATYVEEKLTKGHDCICPDLYGGRIEPYSLRANPQTASDPFLWEWRGGDAFRFGQWRDLNGQDRLQSLREHAAPPERGKSQSQRNLAAAKPQRPVPQPGGRQEVYRSRSSRQLLQPIPVAVTPKSSAYPLSKTMSAAELARVRQMPVPVTAPKANTVKPSREEAQQMTLAAKAAFAQQLKEQKEAEMRAQDAMRRAQEAWQNRTHEVESLRDQMQQLEEARMCPVCMENPKDTAFGCGHQCCNSCGAILSECPICRAPIQLRVRLF